MYIYHHSDFGDTLLQMLLPGKEDRGVLNLSLHLGRRADWDVHPADEARCIRGQEQDGPCSSTHWHEQHALQVRILYHTGLPSMEITSPGHVQQSSAAAKALNLPVIRTLRTAHVMNVSIGKSRHVTCRIDWGGLFLTARCRLHLMHAAPLQCLTQA